MTSESQTRDATNDFANRMVGWAGAYLISFVGLVHLLEAGEHFGYATYLGILFLLNFAASVVSALGIVWTGRKWAWWLGVAVAGGALVSLLWSRTIGLPGFPYGVGQWFNFLAWMAVAFELGFLSVAPLALTNTGHKLVQAEQKSIDQEQAPPLLEEEMFAIRRRMEPNMRDLRARLDPKTVTEKRKRLLRERARNLATEALQRVTGRNSS